MSDFWQRLTAPFPARDIEWKVTARTKDQSKGLIVPYFDARAVMERLDDVCGPNGWTAEYRAYGTAWVCRLTLTTPEGPLVREDGADATDIEAAKGGISNALKRAFAAFGCRYLYHYDAHDWVQLEGGRLPRGFRPPQFPAWALPGGSGRPGKAPDPKPTPGVDYAAWIDTIKDADTLAELDQIATKLPFGKEDRSSDANAVRAAWKEQESALKEPLV
jgi:hypothetical protein